MIERVALGLTIYGEARGEVLAGKMAVAAVARNRLHMGRWGQTFVAVCLAPKQFSCWNELDPNQLQLRELAAFIEAGKEPDIPALRQCLWVADGAMTEAFESNVEDATHYFAASLSIAPNWANPPAEYVGRVGAHLFYRNVR